MFSIKNTPEIFRTCLSKNIEQPFHPYEVIELFKDQNYIALLENPGEPSQLGRFSFLCVDPYLVFSSRGRHCKIETLGQGIEEFEADPFETLRKLVQAHKGSTTSWQAGMPPYVGGAVGYLGYEMYSLIEDIHPSTRDDVKADDCVFIFHSGLIAYDGIEKKSWLIVHGFGSTESESGTQALERLANLESKLNNFKSKKAKPNIDNARLSKNKKRMSTEDLLQAQVRPVIDQENYLKMVEKAKEHIFSGDVFEICITNRFDTEIQGNGFDLYDILREVNPSPFASFIHLPGIDIISSSPERFLKLDRESWAETRPIKGTRPRGKTLEEEKFYYQDLLSCEKDRAENIMIVDLSRNDLGRVCEFGTVRVPELRIIEKYQYTYQMVSTVRGRLLEKYDFIDLIRAAFPGGSMTGAPKIESLKIIDQLEPVRRGIYSGSIGYLDFDGAFDLNIVIRTFIKKENFLNFHTGGAIVADSVPDEEYQETLDKAHGLINALNQWRGIYGSNP